jgi:glycosyltransferase involved in cell wall biosynthesis
VKVLHVHSGNLFGGVETMLLTLARHRHAAPDMEPHFAVAFEGSLMNRLRETGAAVHALGEVRVRRPMAMVRARRALSALLREVRPQVVLFHSSWAQAIFGSAVLRERIPFAAWRHDLTTGRHWLERWSARSVPAAIICSSDFIADRTRLTDPAAAVFTVHCPVEVPPARRDRAEIREELRTPDDHVVLIQVGRFERWKGHGLLLEALGEMRDLEKWTCWIVGGAQRPHEQRHAAFLEQRAAELKIESRIRFAGHRAEVGSLLRAADIFCQPNTRPEPFGIAMIEAMHHGLPVVASAAGGALEIVDPRSGVLVPPGDSSAHGRALRALIAAPRLRSSAGEEARRRAVEICGVENRMRQLADVLRVAAEARP